MRILLDSHVILWWFGKPSTLKKESLDALERGDNELYVSAASWWELSIKRALQRLQFEPDLLSAKLDQAEARRLPISFAHAERAAALPPHHSDPFDRMLAAQTLEEQLVLMTRDKAFVPYNVPVIPA